MKKPSRNWHLSLGTAWPGSGIDPSDDVVVIRDEDRGVVYEVVLGVELGKPGIKRLAIMPIDEGMLIDQELLDRVPLRRMAKQARDFVAGQLRVDPGEDLTATTPGLLDTPSPELVASHWKDGWGRREMADHYRVTPKAADAWIRKARNQGLIPPATTGAPRQSGSN